MSKLRDLIQNNDLTALTEEFKNGIGPSKIAKIEEAINIAVDLNNLDALRIIIEAKPDEQDLDVTESFKKACNPINQNILKLLLNAIDPEDFIQITNECDDQSDLIKFFYTEFNIYDTEEAQIIGNN